MRWINLHSLPKPTLLAIYGTVGCLLAALAAEGFLWLTRNKVNEDEATRPHAVCVTIDVSGSMAGGKLEEVKAAASRFIERCDLVRDRVAIVGFSGQASVLIGLMKDRGHLLSTIRQLAIDGGTNFQDAVAKSADALYGATEARCVLFFTDGQPTDGDEDAALRHADQLRQAGVRVFAVATEDADNRYLAKLTGNRGHVIPTSVGDFDAAFRRAEKLMFGGQLMESTDSDFDGQYSVGQALGRVSAWTAFLCVGIGSFLVIAQNRRLNRPAFTAKQAVVVVGGGILVGFAAGLVGQLLYAGFSVLPFLSFVGRLIAWSILGALLARGMAFFIPNLDIEWAWRGGAAGGFLGATSFLVLISAAGDVGGRLAGAAVLGLCVSLMVGLVEAVCREAWLTVVYGPREIGQVNLGLTPVTVGSGSRDTIYTKGTPERALAFRLASGRVRCVTPDGADRTVQPGERFTIGKAEIVVCSPESRYVPRMSQLGSAQANGIVASEAEKGAVVRSGFRLVLSNGGEIRLMPRVLIKVTEIPGLQPAQANGPLGKVTEHPQKPGTFGLVNLSSTTWKVTSDEGRSTQVASGVAIPLRDGLRLDFGGVLGEVIAQFDAKSEKVADGSTER